MRRFPRMSRAHVPKHATPSKTSISFLHRKDFKTANSMISCNMEKNTNLHFCEPSATHKILPRRYCTVEWPHVRQRSPQQRCPNTWARHTNTSQRVQSHDSLTMRRAMKLRKHNWFATRRQVQCIFLSNVLLCSDASMMLATAAHIHIGVYVSCVSGVPYSCRLEGSKGGRTNAYLAIGQVRSGLHANGGPVLGRRETTTANLISTLTTSAWKIQ